MAEETVTIKVEAKDNASKKLEKLGKSLREFGEELSQVGSRMTAAFTVPIVGLAAGLNKMGQDAVKTVADLNKELNDAIASKDKARIAAAQQAINALDPNVRRLAASYGELQRMVAPVQAEFTKMAAQLMGSLVPVLKDLMPTIKNIVTELGNLVKKFTELPLVQRESILKWVGIIAIAGPVVFALGQMIGTVGTLIKMFSFLGDIGPTVIGFLRGIGIASWASLGPIAALVGALAALVWVIDKLGPQALTSLKMLALGSARNLGLISGEQMIQTGQQWGVINPGTATAVNNPGISTLFSPGGGSGNVTVNYAPAMSLGSKAEFEAQLGPYILSYLHKQGIK